MAITDFPWFKIYAAETLSDENFSSWGLAERGAWFTLLCHCWKEGSIPADIGKLARLCSCNADAMHELWPSIADRFHEQPGTGRMVCLRLEFERQKSLEECEGKSQHGKRAANARWSKYKTDMLGHCSGIAQPMPDDAPQPKPQPKKEVPPKPPRGGIRERKRKTDPLLDLGEISPEAVQFGKALVQGWKKQDPDGRPIRSNLTEVITRMDGIAKRQPIFSPEVQFKAGMDYIAEERKSYKAPQYFLSLEPDKHTGQPPFKPYCVAVVRAQKAAQANPEEMPHVS